MTKPRMKFERNGLSIGIWHCRGPNLYLKNAWGSGLTPEAAYAAWLQDDIQV